MDPAGVGPRVIAALAGKSFWALARSPAVAVKTVLADMSALLVRLRPLTDVVVVTESCFVPLRVATGVVLLIPCQGASCTVWLLAPASFLVVIWLLVAAPVISRRPVARVGAVPEGFTTTLLAATTRSSKPSPLRSPTAERLDSVWELLREVLGGSSETTLRLMALLAPLPLLIAPTSTSLLAAEAIKLKDTLLPLVGKLTPVVGAARVVKGLQTEPESLLCLTT